MDSSTTVVIGAGIVGLHIARVLREKGHDVFVLDGAPYLAEHTSGRNSGVIHSGVFYRTGSFKETVCIEGNRLTYEWLKRLNVPYVPCGKWVVPEEGQEPELEPFFDRIRKLPIPPPRIKSSDEVRVEECLLRPTRAILIPSTGILDAATYVKSMATFLEEKGVPVILNCRVLAVDQETLRTTRGDMHFDLAINCAGLFSDEIAAMAGVNGYEIKPCRGDYYMIPRRLIGRPVYHLPYHGAYGLGIHLTPTVDGQTLVGPNAFFIDGKTDYRHVSDVAGYEKAVCYYLPEWSGGSSGSLSAAYSGNRPKLFLEGTAKPEFTVLKKGCWVHLLGIESPGLTAAPALANHVAGLIDS